jgi:hypothetical protein
MAAAEVLSVDLSVPSSPEIGDSKPLWHKSSAASQIAEKEI